MFDFEALPVEAIPDGFGIVCPFRDGVRPHSETGTLVRVSEDGCRPFTGNRPDNPSRREQERALAVLIAASLYRG